MGKIKLEFTLDELNLLIKAIKQLPIKEVSALYKNIINQYVASEKEREQLKNN